MAMYNPPDSIYYDGTLSIHRQRIVYFRSKVLKREDRQPKDILIDTAVCNEKKFILIHFIDEETKKTIKESEFSRRVNTLSISRYCGKSHSYYTSLNAALTNLKIYHVQRLTRVPFFWDSKPKYLALMVIDVSSLSEEA